MNVGVRLIFTSLIFIVHGIFPFIEIPRWLNLEDSIYFLDKENDNRETKKSAVCASKKITRRFPPNDFPLPTNEEIEKAEKKND